MIRKETPESGLVREPVAEFGVQRVSATAAARNLSDLLNRVKYREERFLIERGGEPVAELVPVSPPRFTGPDLLALMRSLPEVDAGFMDDLEEIGRNQPALGDSPWD